MIPDIVSGSWFFYSFDYFLPKGRDIHKLLFHLFIFGDVWEGVSILTPIFPIYTYGIRDTPRIG